MAKPERRTHQTDAEVSGFLDDMSAALLAQAVSERRLGCLWLTSKQKK